MALADITLNDGQGTPVAHTFSYVRGDGQRVVRNDFAANPETPLTLTHGHQDRKMGGVNGKSHLMRIDKGILDGDGVTVHVPNIRVMADIPNPVLSDALADDLAAFVRNWATSANVRAWLRGSVG